MALLTDFYTRLNPKLPGCPEPVVAQALIDTAIEFCQDTYILGAFTSFTSTAGTQTYTVPAPSNADLEVDVVRRVWYKDRELAKAADHLIDVPEVIRSTSFGTQETGDPRRFLRTLDSGFTVYPIPNVTTSDAFSVFYSMRPKLTATTLPDELYIHWRDALISGTLARARSTPGQPWSASPTLDNNMYQYYRSKAKAVVARGYSSAHIRVITRGFGR